MLYDRFLRGGLEFTDKGEERIVFLSQGKIQAPNDLKNDPLKLVRKITYEEMKAVLRITAREDALKYDAIIQAVISSDSILKAYYELFPDGQRPEFSGSILANDILARALEILSLKEEGLIEDNEITAQESKLVDAVRPIAISAASLDRSSREARIRIAIANGIDLARDAAGDGFIAQGNKSIKVVDSRISAIKNNNVSQQFRARLEAVLRAFLVKCGNDLGKEKEYFEDMLLQINSFTIYGFDSVVVNKDDFFFGTMDLDGREIFIATDVVSELDAMGPPALADEYLLHEILCPVLRHYPAIKVQQRYFGNAHYPDATLLAGQTDEKPYKGLLGQIIRKIIDRRADELLEKKKAEALATAAPNLITPIAVASSDTENRPIQPQSQSQPQPVRQLSPPDMVGGMPVFGESSPGEKLFDESVSDRFDEAITEIQGSIEIIMDHKTKGADPVKAAVENAASLSHITRVLDDIRKGREKGVKLSDNMQKDIMWLRKNSMECSKIFGNIRQQVSVIDAARFENIILMQKKFNHISNLCMAIIVSNGTTAMHRREKLEDRAKKMPRGSPWHIAHLLRNDLKEVPASVNDIRMLTKGDMPDGYLSEGTVLRDLGTLAYCHLVEKKKYEDGTFRYSLVHLDDKEWPLVQQELTRLGGRPSTVLKHIVKKSLLTVISRLDTAKDAETSRVRGFKNVEAELLTETGSDVRKEMYPIPLPALSYFHSTLLAKKLQDRGLTAELSGVYGTSHSAGAPEGRSVTAVPPGSANVFGGGDLDANNELVRNGQIIGITDYKNFNSMDLVAYARKMRLEKGVKRLYFDLDLTVFRSKGYLSSSKWFEHVVKIYGFEQTLKWWGKNGHETRQIKNGFFYRLMDPGLPGLLAELKREGFEIVGLTARAPDSSKDTWDKDEKRTMEILNGLGVPIDHVIFTEGAEKKGMEMDKYEAAKDGRPGAQPSIFVEDSFKNLDLVIKDRKNVYGIHYKPLDSNTEDGWSYKDYFKKAEDAVSGGEYKFAFEYYYNAVVKILELKSVDKINGPDRSEAYKELQKIYDKLLALKDLDNDITGFAKLFQIVEISKNPNGKSRLFSDDISKKLREEKEKSRAENAFKRIEITTPEGASIDETLFTQSLKALASTSWYEYGEKAETVTGSVASINKTGQSLILYADDVLEAGLVVDLENTIKNVLSNNGILSGGKIIIYAKDPASAVILDKLVKRYSGNGLETIVIAKSALNNATSEVKEADAIARIARAKGAKDILGIIKGPSKEPEELAVFAREASIPVVLVGPEKGIYSFAQALVMVIDAKQNNGATNGWLMILPPIKSLTEEIKAQYESYQRSLAALVAA